MIHLMMLLDNSIEPSRRMVWSRDKSLEWWTEIVPKMDDKQFKENFRLERSTVSLLIKHVGPLLKKNETQLRSAIPVEKRICCALYNLGSESELRTIGHLFGIGKSTAGEILHEFRATVVDSFFYRLVKFPVTNEEIKRTVDGFLNKFDYPMCLGALDGTHISIKPPQGLELDYYNYKKFHSIIMLATVDSNLLFTYVNVGAPGRCNDTYVYSKCQLYDVVQGDIYSKYYMKVNNTSVQTHLIADSAFPLDRTLMKPYAIQPDMPKENATFNYRLSRCRSTVERAFGILKNRFRCLKKKMEFHMDNTTNIIKTLVVLHNLCIFTGDNPEVDWDILVPETIYKKTFI
ncbi:unnamed protein product [Rotaria socialis]|uniref:DDE Tnp4 domain-containing protein n=2 Tax=Rotaria socialis TaxID=392032 RepID=A0A818K5H6_9BILA|nr:unnamed protein product [Rotaria socialis]